MERHCTDFMESFGQQLKSLREQKGLSIQEISEKTKIAIANLELLEKDKFELLPPKVFIKGFVRSYAQCLGVNQDEMVKRFEHCIKEGEPFNHLKEDESFFMQKQKRPHWSKTIRTVVLTVVGTLSLVILLLTGFDRLFLNDGSKQDIPVVKTVQPKDGKGFLKTDKDSNVFRADNGFDVSQPGQDGKKVLEIRSISQAWVRVTPDSGPAHDLVMAPGDVKVFTANETFHIMTGNAGGIRLKYDGQRLPVLGKVNQTVIKKLP